MQRETLTTDRLALRPPRPSDAADITRLAGNRKVAEMTSRIPHPYRHEDAVTFIETVAQARPERLDLSVTLAGSGTLVGGCGIGRRQPDELPELGYWIGEPYWGHGYATEAARALIAWAFRATAADAIQATCRVVNPASRRVLRKCGFRYDGESTVPCAALGETVPVERYNLDRDAWLAALTEANRETS